VPRGELKASKYNFLAPAPSGGWILFNGLTGAMYELSPDERAQATLLLAEASSGPQASTPLAQALLEGGMLVSRDTDEVAAVIGPQHRGRNGVLELTLVPTYECNFRCTYCYVDFRRSEMAPWVEDAICLFVERELPAYQRLVLNWFGGEPMLELATMTRLSDRLAGIARGFGVPCTGMVATNGYLLDPGAVRRLVECGVHFVHVTLDGPARVHDLTRPLRTGAPTFDILIDNVRAALSAHDDVFVTLRMNATEETVGAFAEVLDLVPEAVRHRIQVNATEVRGEGIRPSLELRQALNAVVRRALEMGYGYYDGLIGVGRGAFCHGDRPGHFQIGPDGFLHTCSPSSEKPEVQVGRVTRDGRQMTNERHAAWVAAPPVHQQCHDCPYLCFCHGGCMLDRVRGRSPEVCQERYADMSGLIVNRYLAAERGLLEASPG
jgi:uncharacterized protein